MAGVFTLALHYHHKLLKAQTVLAAPIITIKGWFKGTCFLLTEAPSPEKQSVIESLKGNSDGWVFIDLNSYVMDFLYSMFHLFLKICLSKFGKVVPRVYVQQLCVEMCFGLHAAVFITGIAAFVILWYCCRIYTVYAAVVM